jgi:hypothetical protein
VSIPGWTPFFGKIAGLRHRLTCGYASAVNGITPAQLPTLHQLDELAQTTGLRGQQFTAVGYGATERQHEPGGGSPEFTFPDTRMFAVSTFRALNKSWLRLSQNPATGDAGTCYGDSGGPNFLGAGSGETDIIAAITITGDTPCRATNVVYRLDSVSAQAFLAEFGLVDAPTVSAAPVTASKATKDRDKADKGKKAKKASKDRGRQEASGPPALRAPRRPPPPSCRRPTTSGAISEVTAPLVTFLE